MKAKKFTAPKNVICICDKCKSLWAFEKLQKIETYKCSNRKRKWRKETFKYKLIGTKFMCPNCLQKILVKE